ncbi:hypothetical protein PDL71_15475 [Lacibacter sp. MH-610]|uniref:hypothetical protein n=1 Tax=Lacibacter sp. MH-610 TaxID=3020883 RepID=UPI003891F3F5
MVANIVLPSNEVPVPDIGNAILQIRSRQEALQRKQQQDQEDTIRYLTEKLDYSKFGTGTAADENINNMLNGIYTKYADRIKNNKGMNSGQVLFEMQQDVNGIKAYSQNVQALRKNIDDYVTKYTQNAKDIDGNLLKRNALTNALFKIDPNTGQPKLKDPGEIDPNVDYVGEIIKNRPEDVFGTNLMWVNDRIKAMEETPLSGEVVRDRGGVKRTAMWEAKLKPFETVLYDGEGKPKGAGIKTKVEKLFGKDVATLDPEVYGIMFGGSEDEFRIRAAMRRMAKEKGVFVDPNTPEGEIMKRAVAYDLLKGFRPQGDFKYKDKEDEDTWRSKQNAGITIINQGGGKKDEVPTYDMFGEVENVLKAENRIERGVGISPKLLPIDIQTQIKTNLENSGYKDITPDKYWLKMGEDGVINIYRKKGSQLTFEVMGTISKPGMNIEANKKLGQKATQKAAKDQKQTTTPSGIQWK